MDYDKQHRRQILHVAITEVVMTLSVVILTVVFAMIVSGYWFNSDFKIVQDGFLQVYTVPSGATVDVDGDVWFARTNASQMLSKGKKTVTLSREGYDTWSKTITISEGLLYRLGYPRLFKEERIKKEALDFATWNNYFVSNDKTKLAVIDDDKNIGLIDLTSDSFEVKQNTIATFLDDAEKIESAVWNDDNNKLLAKTTSGRFLLINLNKMADSVNLNKVFKMNFENILITDHSADKLMALTDGQLRTINVPDLTISKTIAENVSDVLAFDNEAFYVAQNGLYYMQNDKIRRIMDISERSILARGKFYDDNYLVVVGDNIMKLYPESYLLTVKDEAIEEEYLAELPVMPNKVKFGPEGNFVMMESDGLLLTFDMEEMALANIPINGRYGWIDNNMLFNVKDGTMSVCDFDGLNNRVIVKQNVDADSFAAITQNKFLFYISGHQLIREEL